jgi:hypothetical protein
MIVAFLRAAVVHQVILCDATLADRWCASVSCNAWMIVPEEEQTLRRALVAGATVQGIEAARIPGSLEIDRSKITGITPPPADA